MEMISSRMKMKIYPKMMNKSGIYQKSTTKSKWINDRLECRVFSDTWYVQVKAQWNTLLWMNGLSEIFKERWIEFRKDHGDTNIDEYFMRNYPDQWVKNAFDWNKAEPQAYFKHPLSWLDYWQKIQNEWLTHYWKFDKENKRIRNVQEG